MPTFPAFLDTCALYGAYLCDTLLCLAEAGTYRPLWSVDVLVRPKELPLPCHRLCADAVCRRQGLQGGQLSSGRQAAGRERLS